MPRCPHCDCSLPADRRRVGARCPSCHDPLYEPPGRASRPTHAEETACAAHPGAEGVGCCARCNRSLCETCRTRWQGRIVCATCVDHAISNHEAILTPSSGDVVAADPVREQARQAHAALTWAVVAWLIGAVAVGTLQYNDRLDGGWPPVATLLALLALLVNVTVASAAVGNAVAALRSGNLPSTDPDGSLAGEVTRWLALAGLLLGGLYLGGVLGVATLTLWQS